MEFKITELGGETGYLEVRHHEGSLEISMGYADSHARAIATHMSREQAVNLAAALQVLANAMSPEPSELGA